MRTAAIVARNVLAGGNLLALSRAFSMPRKSVSYVQECLFAYENYFGRRGFVNRHITAELAPGRGPIAVRLAGAAAIGASSWFGKFPSYAVDLLSLCQLTQVRQPSVIFEIGTLHGFTAYHFALNSGPGARVYTLDLPPGGGGGTLRTTAIDDLHARDIRPRQPLCFIGTPEEERITCLYGDSATFDFTPFRDSVDLFFVDGAHSYDYVRCDSANAIDCCRSGGVIVWHDFGRVGLNGVTRHLRELARRYRVCTVPGSSLAYMVKP